VSSVSAVLVPAEDSKAVLRKKLADRSPVALESLTLGAHRLLPGIDHPTLRERVLLLRGAGGAGFARARAPIEVRVRLVLGAEPAVLFVDGLTSRGSTELPGGVTVGLGELDLPRGTLP
jgi:hypothetical protein